MKNKLKELNKLSQQFSMYRRKLISPSYCRNHRASSNQTQFIDSKFQKLSLMTTPDERVHMSLDRSTSDSRSVLAEHVYCNLKNVSMSGFASAHDDVQVPVSRSPSAFSLQTIPQKRPQEFPTSEISNLNSTSRFNKGVSKNIFLNSEPSPESQDRLLERIKPVESKCERRISSISFVSTHSHAQHNLQENNRVNLPISNDAGNVKTKPSMHLQYSTPQLPHIVISNACTDSTSQNDIPHTCTFQHDLKEVTPRKINLALTAPVIRHRSCSLPVLSSSGFLQSLSQKKSALASARSNSNYELAGARHRKRTRSVCAPSFFYLKSSPRRYTRGRSRSVIMGQIISDLDRGIYFDELNQESKRRNPLSDEDWEALKLCRYLRMPSQIKNTD